VAVSSVYVLFEKNKRKKERKKTESNSNNRRNTKDHSNEFQRLTGNFLREYIQEKHKRRRKNTQKRRKKTMRKHTKGLVFFCIYIYIYSGQ